MMTTTGKMVAVGGGIVSLGWMVSYEPVLNILHGFATMKFITAVCFVVSGIMLDQLRTRCNVLSVSCAMCLIWVSLIVTQFGGIIRLPYADFDLPHMSLAPGMPSAAAMLAFTVLGAYGIVHTIESDTAWVCRVLASVVAFIGASGLLGYLVGSAALMGYAPGLSSAMAIHTSALFLLCGWSAWRSAR